MRVKFLYVVLLLLLASPSWPYTYRGSVKRSESAKDSEYESLLAKYPHHKNVIDKLYADYSGWVITISERYGISPLLAVCGRDDAENVLPILWRYGETFTEIFDALGGLTVSENLRAEISLGILAGFTIWDSESKERYYSDVKSAGLKDSSARLKGSKANHYARKIPDSSKFPDNFLHGLKSENPDAYAKFLHEISQASYDTLKAICDYPNGLAFLLNTGRDGARLIDATDGQIIVLSWFLPDDVQRGLPEIFRKYPRLSEALKFCGADSYFTIMLCPELFFALSGLLDGTNHERFMMSYAVILSHSDSGEDAVKFLKSLTARDCRNIARYAAEIMNLPDDDKNFGGSLAPVNEPLFMRFVLSYGDDAADLCKKFSALLDVSKLFMLNWRGNVRDVSPVIEAADDFGLMGLQAAIHFRDADEMQKFILSYPSVSKRRDLLMFMLYDDVTGHQYTENIATRSGGAEWMLENYTIDRNTGEPVQTEETLTGKAVGYIPGHDIIAPVYNYVRYGKTPTLMECVQGAIDLYDLIPIAGGAAAIVKGFASGNGKRVLTSYAKSAAKETATESLKAAGKETLKTFAKRAGITFGEMRNDTAKIFRSLGTRSAVLIAEMRMPSWENISDFTKYMADKAKTLSINPAEKISVQQKNKRSGGFLINETSGSIQKAAMMKTLHIMGMNSALNHLVSR